MVISNYSPGPRGGVRLRRHPAPRLHDYLPEIGDSLLTQGLRDLLDTVEGGGLGGALATVNPSSLPDSREERIVAASEVLSAMSGMAGHLVTNATRLRAALCLLVGKEWPPQLVSAISDIAIMLNRHQPKQHGNYGGATRTMRYEGDSFLDLISRIVVSGTSGGQSLIQDAILNQHIAFSSVSDVSLVMFGSVMSERELACSLLRSGIVASWGIGDPLKTNGCWIPQLDDATTGTFTLFNNYRRAGSALDGVADHGIVSADLLPDGRVELTAHGYYCADVQQLTNIDSGLYVILGDETLSGHLRVVLLQDSPTSAFIADSTMSHVLGRAIATGPLDPVLARIDSVSYRGLVCAHLGGVFEDMIMADSQFLTPADFESEARGKGDGEANFVALSYIQTWTSTREGHPVPDPARGAVNPEYYLSSLYHFAKSGPGAGLSLFYDIKAASDFTNEVKLSHIQSAYKKARETQAVIDPIDLQHVRDARDAATMCRDTPVSHLQTLRDLKAFSIKLKSKELHVGGSFWSRIWTAQETLLSANLTYQGRVDVGNAVKFEAHTRAELLGYKERIDQFIYNMYKILGPHAHKLGREYAAVFALVITSLERLRNLLHVATLYCPKGGHPMDYFYDMCALQERRGKHMGSLVTALRLMFNDLGVNRTPQDMMNAAASSVVRKGGVPMPGLYENKTKYCWAPDFTKHVASPGSVSTNLFVGLGFFSGGVHSEHMDTEANNLLADDGFLVGKAHLGSITVSKRWLNSLKVDNQPSDAKGQLRRDVDRGMRGEKGTFGVVEMTSQFSYVTDTKHTHVLGFIRHGLVRTVSLGYGNFRLAGLTPGCPGDGPSQQPYAFLHQERTIVSSSKRIAEFLKQCAIGLASRRAQRACRERPGESAFKAAPIPHQIPVKKEFRTAPRLDIQSESIPLNVKADEGAPAMAGRRPRQARDPYASARAYAKRRKRRHGQSEKPPHGRMSANTPSVVRVEALKHRSQLNGAKHYLGDSRPKKHEIAPHKWANI